VKNSARVPTRPQLPIAKMDRVQTGNGRVEITFIDDSTVKVTEHSKLVIDDFVYSGRPSTSRMALKFASGTARFATGQGGKINKSNINLRTPTATIAVRGTDFAATVDDFGKSLIVLLPEPDGSVGEITVSNAAGFVILNKAFQATIVSTMDSRPSRPVILNLTLGMIDNMLIVSPAEEVLTAEEVVDTRTNLLDLTELDVDFLASDDLKEDQLASSDLDINAINSDFLGEDFLDDLSTEECMTREGTKLCGTRFGLDNSTQITTIMSGDYLRLVRTLSTTVDVVVKKDSNKTLFIDSNGKSFLIEINEPAGGTIINVKQSE
jgi:FecR protein